MTTIIKRALRDRFWSFAGYTFGGIMLVLLYVAMLPSMEQSQSQIQEVLKTMPEELLRALGVSGIDMSSLEALLAMKQYNMIWPLMMMFFLVSYSGYLIAGEVENRTIEIVLSSAKSRAEIFLGKYLSGLIYMILFVALTTLCSIPLAELFGYSYLAENYYSLFYLSLAFAFAVYGISIFLSSAFSSKGRIFALSGLIYVLMYVAFIISSLKESLESIRYISFFNYYNINDALMLNEIHANDFIIFLTIGFLFSALGYYIFQKRDFAI